MKIQSLKQKTKKVQPKKEEFQTHLFELRIRAQVVLVWFLAASLVGYFFRNQFLAILIRPLHQTLFYSSPAGGLDFVFKISFFFGFLASLPLICFEAIQFIEPALPQKLPRLLVSSVAASFLLLICGVSFGYFVSLPAALYFLNTFAGDDVKALISTTEYFSFVTHYLVGFGLIFQLPLILLIINAVRKISFNALWLFERWIILISFVLAAVLTPTSDILNQLIMAVPLILLYQLSILFIWFYNKNRK